MYVVLIIQIHLNRKRANDEMRLGYVADSMASTGNANRLIELMYLLFLSVCNNRTHLKLMHTFLFASFRFGQNWTMFEYRFYPDQNEKELRTLI